MIQRRFAPTSLVPTAEEIVRAIPYLAMGDLSRCIEAMIERLDWLDGDPDFEPEWDVGADDLGEDDAP